MERNAKQAKQAKRVKRAEEWRWSSLWRRVQRDPKLVEFLSEWPVERPRRWVQWVNGADKAAELEDVRCSAQRGRPFGGEAWVVRMAKRLGLESTLHPRGRPKQR